MYYTYILRCADNSLYTGITTDLDRRLSEHSKNKRRSAKYTLTHPVLSMEIAWISENRSLASKLEYRIKTLTKTEKESLITSGKLCDFFDDETFTAPYTLYKSR